MYNYGNIIIHNLKQFINITLEISQYLYKSAILEIHGGHTIFLHTLHG
jgi:hypothetical protein